jgi:hypothetical protein
VIFSPHPSSRNHDETVPVDARALKNSAFLKTCCNASTAKHPLARVMSICDRRSPPAGRRWEKAAYGQASPLTAWAQQPMAVTASCRRRGSRPQHRDQ